MTLMPQLIYLTREGDLLEQTKIRSIVRGVIYLSEPKLLHIVGTKYCLAENAASAPRMVITGENGERSVYNQFSYDLLRRLGSLFGIASAYGDEWEGCAVLSRATDS